MMTKFFEDTIELHDLRCPRTMWTFKVTEAMKGLIEEKALGEQQILP